MSHYKMKKIFTDLYNGLGGSMHNKPEGWSSKKLTALSISVCVIAAHAKWIMLGDFSQLTTVLTIDFSFISVLYGINVTDKKINPSETGPS